MLGKTSHYQWTNIVFRNIAMAPINVWYFWHLEFPTPMSPPPLILSLVAIALSERRKGKQRNGNEYGVMI